MSIGPFVVHFLGGARVCNIDLIRILAILVKSYKRSFKKRKLSFQSIKLYKV